MRWRRIALVAGGVLLASAAGAALVLDRLYPPDLSRYQDVSAQVVDRQGGLLRPFVTADGKWRFPVEGAQVDRHYLDLLVAYEDRRFYWHPGVDPLALARAAATSAWHGRVVSGGSTLTMQVARLLEPHRRDLAGKLREIVRAVQLERRYSKAEILGMYLTLAPFGGNLEGVRAASLAYFGTEPATLTTGQAALLIAIPQSPRRVAPGRQADGTEYGRNRVLTRLVASRTLSPDQRAEALEETLPTSRRPMPRHAAHLAQAVVKQDKNPILRTSIDGKLQALAEALARGEGASFPDGAAVALLVVENKTRAVRAYLSGADFFGPAGQVDLVRARRSPGSTLKPFVYGLAFDDLAIHPETLIDDRPMRFGDYAPQNFDRDFRGTVTVREALQQSLNLPAVQVLDRIGPERLSATLGHAGLRLDFPKTGQRPGLSLVLGGVGVSLFDLVTGYTALANRGIAAPLQVRDGAVAQPETRLVGPAAAAYLARILADGPLPDGLVPRTVERGQRWLAYKTGTSYGFRDAWAIGYSANYTIGVWVGRADGTPRPGAYGRNAAAPVLFRLFDQMPADPALLPPLPADAIDAANNASLPLGLQRFSPTRMTAEATGQAAVGRAVGGATLQVISPPDGATVDLDAGAATRKPVYLKATGGAEPYTWMVNGELVGVAEKRPWLDWQPTGSGFFAIKVIDRDGRIATADLRVR